MEHAIDTFVPIAVEVRVCDRRADAYGLVEKTLMEGDRVRLRFVAMLGEHRPVVLEKMIHVTYGDTRGAKMLVMVW